ncbi:MAG: ABC transporter ATP-binding protein [Oligoflexia bacterium]|nr:ABC transporter ATP-binding protein [Oligoflexia bacterium]
MSVSTSFVRAENVRKNFGSVEVLKGVNLSLAPKEHFVIKGASGSGKSTFLHLLAGLDSLTSGKIFVDDCDLSKMNDTQLAIYRNKNVGLVFQFHYLLPSIKCEDNLLLPARISESSTAENLSAIRERVINLASELGVSHCLNKYPYELSGGEQQRINIIRALSLKPKLLLCDEPTGNLDSVNSDKVSRLLKELAEEFAATLIVVTHNERVASCFPREIVMKDGLLFE